MLYLCHLVVVASDPIAGGLRQEIKRLYDTNVMTKAFTSNLNPSRVNLLNGNFLGYRLGDILLAPHHDFNDIGQSWTNQFSSRNTESGGPPSLSIADMATILWPTSLGADVVNTLRRCNITLPRLSTGHNPFLRAILNLRCPKPEQDRIVIHLRIGDQLDRERNCREDPLFNKCTEGRMMRPSTLGRVAKLMREHFQSEKPEIVLVAGMHRTTLPHDGLEHSAIVRHLRESHTLGERYISIVRRAFAAYGFNTSLVSGTPDCDFCKMYTARWLMPTPMSRFSTQASMVTLGQVMSVHGTGETAQLTVSNAPVVQHVSESRRQCVVASGPLTCPGG